MENSTLVESTTASGFPSTTTDDMDGNTTEGVFENPFENMPIDSNFAWLLCALSIVFIWMIYGSCFHSRVVGAVIGFIVNQYLKRKGLGELSIGSLKIGVVSGRLAFRNVRYINEDYSILIYDGYIWFRYWMPYKVKQLSEFRMDSHRLFMHFYGLEVYYYNRTDPVAQIVKIRKDYEKELYERFYGRPMPENSPDTKKGNESPKVSNAEKINGWANLRNLFAVVDIKLNMFRVVLGNFRSAYSLVVGGSSASLCMTYEAATLETDPFATVITGSMKNVEASFQVNPDYPGEVPTCPYDRSDRKGKLKFFSTEAVQINRYHVDNPTDIITVLLENRPDVSEQLMKWSTELTLVGRTDIVYGGWIDARRAEMHRALFPPTRSELPVTNTVAQRMYKGFDLLITTKASVYCTIYFVNDQDQVHKFILSCDPGTEFNFHIPYILREQGFATNINLKAKHLRGVTSLAAKNLLEADEMNMEMVLKYSRVHHGPQQWDLDFNWTNASVFFLYEHKQMVSGMIHDWTSGSDKPDLLKFVPFLVNIKMNFNGFDLITYTNQFNWIDCTKTGLENCYTVFGGPQLNLAFSLNFLEFMVPVSEVPFKIAASHVDVRLFFPDAHTQYYTIASLYQRANVETFAGQKMSGVGDIPRAFRDTMLPGSFWCRTWSVENFHLGLNYCFHNAPYVAPGEMPRQPKKDDNEPDMMELEMSIAASQMLVTGSLIKCLYNAKENYFGASQEPNSMETSITHRLEALLRKSVAIFQNNHPAERSRSLDVNVVGNFSNTTAHLLLPSEASDPPCPRVFAKKVSLEVLKQYEETTLQVVVHPIVLDVADCHPSEGYTDPMRNGQALVSFVQVRGHAMFSDYGVPPGDETCEYAWLLDIQVGDAVIRASLPQLLVISKCLEALALTIDDTEDDYQNPEVLHTCIHGFMQPLCPQSSTTILCPQFEEIKYRMTRFSMDSFHLYLVDNDSFLNLQVEPVWLSTCNLRSPEHEGGLSLIIPNTTLRQFIWSHVTPLADQDVWMEATSLKLGVLQIDLSSQLADASNNERQLQFLREHDTSSHRLGFLWDSAAPTKPTRCACVGGSEFFGRDFTSVTWKGLGAVVDMVNFTNEPGLEIGQRIFDVADIYSPLDIVSLETLLAKFASREQVRSRLNSGVSPKIAGNGNTSVSPTKGRRTAWIPDRRRPSIGSVDSYYSATGDQQEQDEFPENDIAKDVEKVSVAALSQVTISTISMAPDQAPVAITVSNFPVNLHAQFSKKTHESPLLMAGYVPQIPLWQRSVINVTIGDDVKDSGTASPRFSFYLPNLEKVKGGLDVSTAFRPKHGSLGKPGKLKVPKHYRSQSSQLSAGTRFVEFGSERDASNFKGPAKIIINIDIVGNTDVMVTPISCDALLPMIHSLDGYLSELRPMSFLNGMYAACVAKTKSMHKFDMDKIMVAKIFENLHQKPNETPITVAEARRFRALLSRDPDKPSGMQSAAESTSTHRPDLLTLPVASAAKAAPSPTAGGFLFGDQPWIERKFVHEQFSVNIDQINLVTLQCGIVEEVVEPKALENPRDLICVSVFAGSLRSLSATYVRRRQVTYSAKIYVDRRTSRPPVTHDRKAPVEPLSPLSGIFDLPDIVGAESKTDKVTDSLVSLSVQTAHFQLRRLKHSEIWRKARITCIGESKSGTWFDYNPKASPVDENSPYQKIFSDLTGTDQTGFIVLELGVDDVRIEGGGRTESDEHLNHNIADAVPVAKKPPVEEPVPRAPSKMETGKDGETDSRHSGGSTHTFIAHGSDEEEEDENFSPDIVFKLLATIGGCWLNCPTPSKKQSVEHVSAPDTQLRGFTRWDWHFLSTANPMVDAWLYPLDRTNVALKSMASNQHRNEIILASYFLIASVNDHILPKSSKMKLARHTLKSRVFQEDCCSRLSRIVQRHGLSLTREEIVSEFKKELIPPIHVLEQGIHVLFKQLRYTPFARVLLEPQYLVQKFKPAYKSRDPTTMDSSATRLADDLDITMAGEDDMFVGVNEQIRQHPESPYPPLEQDLNKWLEEGNTRVPVTKTVQAKAAAKAKEEQEDSDSPYEDMEFGGDGASRVSVEYIFGTLLEHLGMKKKSTVSLVKKFVGFHASLSGRLDTINISLVESVEFGVGGILASSKDSFGKITAFRSTLLTVAAEILLDIPLRSLDLFIPDYRERLVITHRTSRISVLTYKCDVAEVAQAVSMPLLRLLAQIGSVITSMQRVRANLKKNWPDADKKGHRKTDSTSTSGSGTSRSDSPAQPRARVNESYIDFVAPESSKHWKDLMMLMDLYDKPAEHRIMDETKSRNRKVSTYGANRVKGSRFSFRKQKRNSTSDVVSSSVHQSDEAPESPAQERKLLDGEADSEAESEIDNAETGSLTASRAVVEAAAQRRIRKTVRYGTSFAVCGTASIRGMTFEASLRGLTCQAVLSAFSFNHNHTARHSRYNSLDESYYQMRTGQLSVQLVQKMGHKPQLYLGVGLGSSQLVYSTSVRNKNQIPQRTLCVRMGELHFSVPHHPITLHAMIVRGTEDLTDAVEDLKATAGIKVDSSDEVKSDGSNAGIGESAASASKSATNVKSSHHHHHKQTGQFPIKATVYVKTLIITAAPLPSLEASYEISKIMAHGSIGNVTLMHLDIGPQDLVFKSKNEDIESTANFQLPAIYIKCSYELLPPVKLILEDEQLSEFKDARALYITARVGSPDYTFSTDALKYTVLFQKVFMKEIEDVLDALSQPISQQQFKISLPKKKFALPFFHQINVQQDGIRITGTTPTSSAVRLEIDKTAMYISNIPKSSQAQSVADLEHSTVVSVQLDVGICLGQLVKGEQQQVYEEAEMDFQPCAHFRTRMTFTNYGEGPLEALLQGYDERIRRKRIVAHLSQPRIYFQPRAIDMAVIFYINYKNAYDYWYEQRHGPVISQSASLTRIKKSSTAHLPHVAQRAIQSIQESIYVIELFISQLYVCMPLPTGHMKSGTSERDSDMALLISLDRTKVRAVLADSIITSGSFDLFRLCFTEDHGPQYDYSGRLEDGFTNCCFVPKGYVEVTSRTTKKETTESGLPKWDLYFKWDMNGIEMHMDPAIGKIISYLTDAVTSFTGEESESSAEPLPSLSSSEDVFGHKYPKHRSKLMEKQMQMHAKVFNELQQSEGASSTEIQNEAEKLKRIEQGIVHELRRDIVNRIRQKSISSRGSVSDYRAHRRTSSTPQSDLSPTTPEADVTHSRTFSADLGPRKMPTNILSSPRLQPTRRKISVEPLKEEISPRSSNAPEAEQAFDFDFTILINIESGHCTFYCAPDKKQKSAQHSAETPFGGSSPRRGSDLNRRANLTPVCTLYIPGVNLEMQYESDATANTLRSMKGAEGKVIAKGARSLRPLVSGSSLEGSSETKTGRNAAAVPRKKGNLFATFSLESLPAETILTPQLLDFMEQALEPIPVMAQTVVKAKEPPPVEESDSEMQVADESWGFESAIESFPVDIFVLFMMNSTKIRCSCLPVSKVEGVLTLPSLSIMVSTRKYNQVIDMEKVRIRPESLLSSGRPVLETLDEMLHQMGPEFRLPDFVDKYEEHAGLGLYGNLSGFSLVIFHPYGTVAETTYYDVPGDRNVKSSVHGAPDKRELVKLELDRLHVEIVRSKSLVDDFAMTPEKDAFYSANSIEFSASISVGKTTFWYDLRRLGEILAFPKAWYRRSIARRFFLGEEAADAASTTSSVSFDPSGKESEESTELHKEHRRSRENGLASIGGEDAVLPWKTLVLVGIKVSALDFNVNMGNVMGNTVLLVEDINCVGRFSAASDGHSDIFAAVVATNLDLNSRGGVVGGGSQWKKAQVYGHVRNEVGAPPMHAFGCLMSSAESKLEYMGAISALARMSKMHVHVRDTWALPTQDYRSGPKLSAAVHCSWDQMQMIICSASTSHVVKSIVRVTEFFEEQLKSSRQFISKLNFTGPMTARRRSSLSKSGTKEAVASLDSRFHRHWQKPLEFLRGYRLKNVPLAPFPVRGGLLKGDVQMNGRNISLACFYGNSFRGKSWARFSIKEPRLEIRSEAIESLRSGEKLVDVVQTMAFNLGKDDAAPFAATVARVTCNNPPPLLNLPDWFEFMFMNSDIDEIGRFPTTHSQKLNTFEDMKLNMTIETILALPLIVIGLRSEHIQTDTIPDDAAHPPVSCNFTCDFGAPISIDMGDSQAFYFLHQLINSYIANTDAESQTGSKREVPNPTEVLKEDARRFQVNEWYLQPSFKLLQRIGRDIETIGVERVMNRLGFAQAQTTIPKWIQRGLVDPVDKGLAGLMLLLMKNSKHDRV